ncbi:MAG: helix-turn-helix domain-containing protein [Bacteroidales bacterium]|nr:helix-turn-helix domain-containing protein [Bacteroidales bacterium]
MKSPQEYLKQRMCKQARVIHPDYYYSLKEAAEYLGINRTSLYRYLESPEKPLEAVRLPGSFRLEIKGSVLISYKEKGTPKRGRRIQSQRKDSSVNSKNTQED